MYANLLISADLVFFTQPFQIFLENLIQLDILNFNSISLIAFVMMNKCFVRTALYRFATSKWTPIICLLLRTTFNFGAVIKGCRCLVSSMTGIMLTKILVIVIVTGHKAVKVKIPQSLWKCRMVAYSIKQKFTRSWCLRDVKCLKILICASVKQYLGETFGYEMTDRVFPKCLLSFL